MERTHRNDRSHRLDYNPADRRRQKTMDELYNTPEAIEHFDNVKAVENDRLQAAYTAQRQEEDQLKYFAELKTNDFNPDKLDDEQWGDYKKGGIYYDPFKWWNYKIYEMNNQTFKNPGNIGEWIFDLDTFPGEIMYKQVEMDPDYKPAYHLLAEQTQRRVGKGAYAFDNKTKKVSKLAGTEWSTENPSVIKITDSGSVTPAQVAAAYYGNAAKITELRLDATEEKELKDEPLKKGTEVRIEFQHLIPEMKKFFSKETINLITREGWGARKRTTAPDSAGKPRIYKPIEGKLEDYYDTIVVHHSGNTDSPSMGRVQEEHMNDYKMADVGYHFGIDLKGQVFEGRPIDIVGSHVGKANANKIGIVLLADLSHDDKGMEWYKKIFEWSDDNMTKQMENALVRLILTLKARFSKVMFLGGHEEVLADRSCPGNITMGKIDNWRTKAKLKKPTLVK